MDRWRVGIDTGGTFTDLVAVRGSALSSAKVPSTPPRYEQGVLDALAAAGIDLAETELVAHGTTVATNAVITGQVAPTALLTTAGFRDVLELRRHNRGDPFDIMWDPPAPIVPRRHRYEVRERLDYAGAIVEPLEEADVLAAVKSARAARITSFATCFLHSYENPDHELRARSLILEAMPEATVSCSCELLREPDEFERTSTTVINACLVPVVAGYLRSLERLLAAAGFRGRLAVMHSGGGLLSVESAARFPARLVTSGPAAGAMAAAGVAGSGSPAGGVTAAEGIARATGLDEVISLDIGGTSADIAVIRGGRARLVNEYSPQFGQVIRFPAVDLVTIGAGGGSIAWVDAGGLPHVGPQSAGAVPGPAAYLRGGTAATVTDANVVLGRLGGGFGLAGGVALDEGAATRAVEEFASRLGLTVAAAALGIVELVVDSMARSIRVVTVERGLDPRDFTLVAFGGAGPLLAAELAAALDMRRVVVPLAPGVTSALGCLHVDIAHDVAEAFIAPLSALGRDAVAARLGALAAQLHERLDLDGVAPDERRIELALDLRYVGQVKALTIPVTPEALAGDLAGTLLERFYEEYERQFHFATRDIPVETAALRARGLRPARRPTIPFVPGRSGAPTTERKVVTKAGELPTPVYARKELPVGTRLRGPAIAVQADSTTWVPPGWQAEVDALGNLVIERTSWEAP
ncbi:MAG TPA: hydantoinase/oxoprolinase family protein [Acidimicrobiales bacterium]|nr:hydantoinase/oxoprolinase family protein [Acidimicrobiales bacterium]